MKYKPPPNGWPELIRSVATGGAAGVISLVLVTVLACIVTGTTAAVIYALIALMGTAAVLTVVVNWALRKPSDGDER